MHDDIVVQNVLGATQSQLGDPIKIPGYVLNAGESTYTSFSATYKLKEYLALVNGLADALGQPRIASAYDLIEAFRSLGSIPNDTYAENSITLNYVYQKKFDQIDLQTHDVTIRIGDPLNVSSFITSIKTSDGTDGSIADVVNNLKDINTSVPGKYNVTLTYLDPDSLSSVEKVSQLTILPKDNVGSDNSGDNNTGNSNVGSDNSGDHNTGNSNIGSDNSGDNNTGNSNVGSDNSGNSNVGSDNSGDHNTGSDNSGDNNTGDSNVGSDNSGDHNTGNSNVGSDNSGDNNTGNSNVGSDNSGDHNTGNSNVGSDNSGENNTGNSNVGSDNSGNHNTGNSNVGSDNSGNNNTGNSNASSDNSGNNNTGNSNTGSDNSGNHNTGNSNVGSDNSGDNNTGNSNVGSDNSGKNNTGNRNVGSDNSGDHNTGNGNVGSDNSGDNNTGNSNVGSDNSGDHNTGNSNVGSDNSGDHNTGNSNVGSDNSGDNNVGNHNVGSNNVGDNNIGNNNTGSGNVGSNNIGENLKGNNLVNPEIMVRNSSVSAGSWQPSDNFVNLKNHNGHFLTSGEITFVNRTVYGYFSDDIPENTIQYILSGDVNIAGNYTVTYMWGNLRLTNIEKADLSSIMKIGSTGMFGDRVWATANITISPMIVSNAVKTDLLNNNASAKQIIALPETDYSSEALVSVVGLMLLGLVGLSAVSEKRHVDN